MEEWKPIPGFEGVYEVSDLGRVRSLARKVARSNGRVLPVRERFLSSHADEYGYASVALSKKGKPRTKAVHALVAEAFFGSPSSDEEVRHLNGKPWDNRLSNLAYGTKSENTLDSVGHGTHNHARVVYCSQGHKLEGENLVVYGKMRQCRSCSNARSKIYPEGVDSPRFVGIANEYYERYKK